MKATRFLALGMAAVLLSSCSTNSEEPITTVEMVVEPSSSTTQPPIGPVDPANFRSTDGSYMVQLRSGEVCSIHGDLVAAPFACLLNLNEPLLAEDGSTTMGVAFAGTMFIPSLEMQDPTVIAAFEESRSGAPMLEPGQSLNLEDFQITAETFDEVLFTQMPSMAQFFIAEQHTPDIWFPRPSWLPVPEIFEGVEEVEELLNP